MSHEYEEMQVEKWVNLEDVAEHLSISQGVQYGQHSLVPRQRNRP